MRFSLKDLSIDTEARTVRRGNEAIRLPDLSFDVLLRLIEGAPAPVSVASLSGTVWRSSHVSDETIAQRIALIRKVLGDDTKAPIYVRTVRNQGYCIAGKVTRLDGISETRLRSRTFAGKSIVTALVACGAFTIAMVTAASIVEPQAQPVLQTVADTEASLLVKRAKAQLSLHQAQETDRAIEMLRAALVREPDLFDAHLTLSFALSTKATKFRGSMLEKIQAEAIARSLIDEQPQSSGAWSALGYTLSSQGRTNEALAAYRQAFGLDPQNASALSSAAHLLLLRGDFQQALVLEMQAKNAGGTSRYAEIQIAQILELIDHPSAEDWRSRALALNPEQAVVLSEAAKSHLRRDDPQAALTLLDQYEGEDNSAPQILVLKGRALIALDRPEEAQKVLELAGWRGHYNLAALHARASDASYAEAFFPEEKQIKLASDPDPDLRIQLAEVIAALGREAEALELVSQAVSLGWRDTRWLQRSPFLKSLMVSERGQQIEIRIAQEVKAQRLLIEATKELSPILDR